MEVKIPSLKDTEISLEWAVAEYYIFMPFAKTSIFFWKNEKLKNETSKIMEC
ncbi:MAG: hypothetical protein R2824_27700 [Saprospiraceae bacterium]